MLHRFKVCHQVAQHPDEFVHRLIYIRGIAQGLQAAIYLFLHLMILHIGDALQERIDEAYEKRHPPFEHLTLIQLAIG